MKIPKIDAAGALRAHFGEPSDLVKQAVVPKLDRHCRRFIEHSPFLVIGSQPGSGSADVSPRGDPPGFVRVLDEATLLIPDRPGNKRVDTMHNVLGNPRVALIFLVPGINECLRVNGRAEITTDPALLAPAAVNGKAPATGLLVHVDEALIHCAKAMMRAKLWDADAQIERKAFPRFGEMKADQIAGIAADDAEARIQDSYRNRLY